MTTLDHRKIVAADADAIVIGGGLNGLTCAAVLAHQRFRVLVLEAGREAGGRYSRAQFVQGYRAPLSAHWSGPFDVSLAKTLKLAKYGAGALPSRLGGVALSPDGRHLFLDPAAKRGMSALAQYSQLDGKTWPSFDNAMRKLASGLSNWLIEPPVTRGAGKGAVPVRRDDDSARQNAAGLAWRSIGSLAEEYFETPLLRGALAFEAIKGSGLGPFSPGTALLWLERLALDTVWPDNPAAAQGNSGGLTQALTQAAQALGAAIRTQARVVDLIVDDGRCHGVILDNHETLFAPLVISSLGPQTIFRWPSAQRGLAPDIARRASQTESNLAVAKVHLALKGLPQWRGLEPRDLRARLLICGGLDELQRGYQAAVDCQLPADVALEVVLPSLFDETLAPAGGHVLSALVAFVPRSPPGGWAAMRDKLVLQTIATLAAFAPDLPNRVLSADVRTPDEIAAASGGPILWRTPGIGPLHASNPYGTPIEGLFLCGGGTHPSAGGAGLNGRNCAEAILATSSRGA